MKIAVASDEKNSLQNIRCLFEKGHEDKLQQLIKGQTVTVQGKFDGSIVQLRMINCLLVR